MEVDNHDDDSLVVDDHHQEQQQQHAIPATSAPASPILPRVAVAESAVMPALQAIDAAYATDSEEENLQIMIPIEERLDVEPLLIPSCKPTNPLPTSNRRRATSSPQQRNAKWS